MIEVKNTIDARGAKAYCVECRDNVEHWVQIWVNKGSETSANFTLCRDQAFKLAYQLMAKASEA